MTPVEKVGTWKVWVPITGVVTFSLDGDPVPKGRPRMTRQGRAYTPKRTHQYEVAVGNAWISLSPRPVAFTSRVAVTVKVRERVYPADLDNYVKIVLDALNGLAWADDQQVSIIHAIIERGSKEPGIQVEIRAVE